MTHPPGRARAWALLGAALALVAVVVALAVLQVRGWNGTVNADGVSYLDLASRYARGESGAIANGYWSPLYPVLLGGALRLAGITGTGTAEMMVVFTVNVAIFALATLAMVRLALTLGTTSTWARGRPAFALGVVRAMVAGTLCIWCLLRMINATAVTPDALLAAWLFLASADIAEVAMSRDDWASVPGRGRDWRFGTVLALGYWTKAVFLPVAIVALGAYVVAMPSAIRRRAMTHALVPLFLVTAPLVAVQSWTQGRPSFGETGRLNYRWYVSGAPHALPVIETVESTRARVRRGEPASVLLLTAPGAVLFTGGSVGTFPYWYDASRYEPRAGMDFSPRAQWETFAFNMRWFRVTAGVFSLFALAAFAAGALRARLRPRRLLAALPAATMLMLYALTHPEGRLGAAPVACLLLVFVHLTDDASAIGRRPLAVVEGIALALLGIVALGRTAKRIPTADAAFVTAPSPASLGSAGIPSGAAIAIIGSPYGHLWAHQAGVRIVALIPAPPSGVVDDQLLRATVTEAAARGVPLQAVVWSGEAAHRGVARPIAPGWWAVPSASLVEPIARPAAPDAAPRPTLPTRPAAPAAAAPRRASGRATPR